jgi:hypothetical protein
MSLSVDQQHKSHTMQGLDCKVDVAESQTWSAELSLLLWLQNEYKNRHGATEQFLTAVHFFRCKLQVSIGLMSNISATSDTVFR